MDVSVHERVKAFIEQNLLFGETVGDDESLMERGAIDSTGILELVAHLECDYGIRVEDREIDPANLDTVGRIAAFVDRKRTSGEGAAE